MKILQLCSKIPFPPKDGGSIAMNMLTDGLFAAGNEVQVLAINTPKHFAKDEEIDPVYRERTLYRSVFIDTTVRPLAAFTNLFGSGSYNVNRFYSPVFEKELISVLKSGTFDIVQLEGLWLAPYLGVIRKNTSARIVLRSHNVEFMIWERLADDCRNPLKKVYLGILAERLKRYELEMLNRYDAIVTITEPDALTFKKLGCTIPVIHVPFAIDLEKYKADHSAVQAGSIFHLGAMDWRPNEDAIRWFLEKVWPEVLDKHPAATLHLAGRGMPQWMKELKLKNVTVDGEVKNSVLYMNSKEIMIVPLKAGGGMRVKIIEGMALGKTIVSTEVGAEGIACENGKNIMIADREKEFAEVLVSLLQKKDLCNTIGKNARTLVETEYDNRLICERLSEFYQTLIRK